MKLIRTLSFSLISFFFFQFFFFSFSSVSLFLFLFSLHFSHIITSPFFSLFCCFSLLSYYLTQCPCPSSILKLRIKDIEKEDSYLSGVGNKIQDFLFFFSSKISQSIPLRFMAVEDSPSVCSPSENIECDVRTLLDMIYLRGERTGDSSKDSVRTVLIKLSDSCEFDTLRISLLQDLARRVGVWRAVQLGSLDRRSSSPNSFFPPSSAPSFPTLSSPLSSSLSSPLFSSSPRPSLSLSLSAQSQDSVLKSIEGENRVACSRNCQGRCVCSTGDLELNSSPFRLFGFTDLHREANLTVSLLNSCVSLFQSPSAPHSTILTEGKTDNIIQNNCLEEEYSAALQTWMNLYGVFSSSSRLESSGTIAPSVSAKDIIKNWPINMNSNLNLNSKADIDSNKGVEESRGARSVAHGCDTTLTALERELIRGFKRNWSDVLQGRHDGGGGNSCGSGNRDRDCDIDGSTEHTNTTAFNSNRNSSSSSSSSDASFCASLYTAKLSLLSVASVITAGQTDYDPLTSGWRTGVSGVGLSLGSRLEARMETVKGLIRELSLSWFLQVQSSSEFELPALSVFQGNYDEKDTCVCVFVCLCGCVCVCVCGCVWVCVCVILLKPTYNTYHRKVS